MRRLLVTAVAVVGIVVAVSRPWACEEGPSPGAFEPTVTSSPLERDSESESEVTLDPVEVARGRREPAGFVVITDPVSDDPTVARPTLLVVHGRLLGARGEPLDPDRIVFSAWELPPDDTMPVAFNAEPRVQGLGAGRFRAEFKVRASGPESFDLVFDAIDGDVVKALDVTWLRAVARIQDARSTGVELGDVHLHEPPILATGVVLDPEGRPTVARVELNQPVSHETKNPRYPAWWSQTCSSDGTFSIRCWSSGSSFVLTASHDEHDSSAPQASTTGDAGIELRLRPSTSGSLEARVLADEGVLPRLRVALERDQGPCPQPDAHLVRREGRVVAPRLPTGRYALVVTVHPVNLVVLRIGGLVVPAQAACMDERLTAIDLRPRLEWLSGSAVDGAGRAARRVAVPYDVGAVKRAVMTDDDGTWRLLVPVERPVLHAVHADGRREPLHQGLVVRVR